MIHPTVTMIVFSIYCINTSLVPRVTTGKNCTRNVYVGSARVWNSQMPQRSTEVTLGNLYAVSSSVLNLAYFSLIFCFFKEGEPHLN